ncbi:hypothetical protein CH063_06030 [Colletotrichum higginsianum]|uniref:EC51a protein n=1 Tax=Colletotrichum higginsianum (strain IMI 349063) TaxID=759273 RepID=H1V136_COLHI|nr:hypothetical protein CH063_06030 [Colletotrichum higginsianum]
MVSLIITLTYLLATVTFALPIDLLGLEENFPISLVTRQDGPTSRYTTVKNAAAAAGKTLNNGEWHYLRLCTPLNGQPPEDHVQEETGCKHFYIVVGQVIKERVFKKRKDFQGLMYHVRYNDDTRKWFWTSHTYIAYDFQEIVYGGKTTSRKASTARLDTLSTAWVDKWGSYCDLNEARCFGYYQYMASNL